MTLSDRIAVMADGRALQVASPKEVYNRPTSITVADFIGQMNFFEARVSETAGEEAVLDAAGFGRMRAKLGGAALQPGASIVAALRPEKLTLSPARSDGAANAVEGVLEAAAYLGDRSHFHVRVAGLERPVAVAAQDWAVGGGDGLDEGAPVWLTWDNDSVILLESERR